MSIENLNILVVDDEKGIRRSLSVFLEDEGASVTSVESAEEALLLQNIESFDIAIVDIRMTGISGDILIPKLYDIKKSMKFIIYTGSQEFEISPEICKLGISDKNVIYKPLADLSILSELISTICSSNI